MRWTFRNFPTSFCMVSEGKHTLLYTFLNINLYTRIWTVPPMGLTVDGSQSSNSVDFCQVNSRSTETWLTFSVCDRFNFVLFMWFIRIMWFLQAHLAIGLDLIDACHVDKIQPLVEGLDIPTRTDNCKRHLHRKCKQASRVSLGPFHNLLLK